MGGVHEGERPLQSSEIVETETMGGVHEAERPLQSSEIVETETMGGEMRESAPSSPVRLWKRKQWEEGGLPLHSNCVNGN